VSVTQENSQFRMLMREVKFFKNYTLMSMTFYVRRNGKCQLHTVWADKTPFKLSSFDHEKCIKNTGTGFGIGTWVLRDAHHHFQIYYYPEFQGGITRRPSKFYVLIHFVSNTTILFNANFLNDFGNLQRLTAALATGTNITEEMWKVYVNLTRYYKIPIANIKNVYETGKSVTVNWPEIRANHKGSCF
uniref:Uncharacterized protein n=1 Tax=Peromyscus maniculatus bairdii TaxID=230844 RepID=A0A8C8U3N1_PERMB